MKDTLSSDDSVDTYIQKLRKKQHYMPLTGHLEELRFKVIRSILYVLFFSVIAYVFFTPVWHFVMKPIFELIYIAEGQGIELKLISTELSENFFTRLKISIFLAIIMSVPMILWEIWRFLAPAITSNQKRWVYVILVIATVLFWLGLLFARFYVWPFLNKFFVFNWALPPILISGKVLQSSIHLSLKDYLSLFFSFHFSFGAAFQMPIISILLALLGLLRSRLFISYWRQALIILAILSATITPPDIFSMLLLVLPLFLLYFISGFAVFLVETKKRT